ncbi:hypothetical protein AX17_006970 [Amanita inopinata Kibby_2008]|nr:hypothetical protein AX17_006970 [Amanita inopinata Kibby_2008]
MSIPRTARDTAALPGASLFRASIASPQIAGPSTFMAFDSFNSPEEFIVQTNGTSWNTIEQNLNIRHQRLCRKKRSTESRGAKAKTKSRKAHEATEHRNMREDSDREQTISSLDEEPPARMTLEDRKAYFKNEPWVLHAEPAITQPGGEGTRELAWVSSKRTAYYRKVNHQRRRKP